MATQTDSSAGLTANDIALFFKVLDAKLNSAILQGQLLGMNSHNLLNFLSNLKGMRRHIYWNCGLHIVEHLWGFKKTCSYTYSPVSTILKSVMQILKNVNLLEESWLWLWWSFMSWLLSTLLLFGHIYTSYMLSMGKPSWMNIRHTLIPTIYKLL